MHTERQVCKEGPAQTDIEMQTYTQAYITFMKIDRYSDKHTYIHLLSQSTYMQVERERHNERQIDRLTGKDSEMGGWMDREIMGFVNRCVK